MRSRGFGRTDTGRRRASNEDSFVIDDAIGVYVICDGMGGHSAGEVAAREAIRVAHGVVRAGLGDLEDVPREERDHDDLANVATRSVEEAARAVATMSRSRPELAGMGCTLTMLITCDDKAAMAHVGDSRLYLLRDGALEQLSTDHTVANDLVRRGLMTRAQGKDSPYSSSLTRCIGQQELPEAETLILDLDDGDRFLLCSDGLTEYVDDLSELAGLMSGEDPQAIVTTLIDMANERGGGDNITVVVVQATDDGRDPVAPADPAATVARLSVLAASDLFQGLRFANLVRLDNTAVVRHFAEGATVIAAGQKQTEMFLVLGGRFARESDDGEALTLGDVFGQEAMLHETTATAAIRCVAEGMLLIFERSAFRKLCRRRPWLGVDLYERIGGSLPGGA